MSSLRKRGERAAQLLRYHEPSQLMWRLIRIAQRKLDERGLFRMPAPVPGLRFRDGAEDVLSAMRSRRLRAMKHRDLSVAEGIASGEFRFLNVTKTLIPADRIDQCEATDVDWTPADMTRLWLFHLQCHEYLLQLAESGHEQLVWSILRSWLEHPNHSGPGRDPNAWHPFCISRRLPIWLMLAASGRVPNDLADDLWCSIGAQACWLRKRPEYDLGGNHLLENLRTLVVFDAMVQYPSSLKVGLSASAARTLACRELAKQMLPTGEHMERTPTYHGLMLLSALEISDALRFANPSDSNLVPVNATVNKMQDLLAAIVHPDHRIPLLSDSVFAETPDVQVLCESRASKILTRGESNSADSSKAPVAKLRGDYWTWRSPKKNFLLVDVGPLAHDSLPAHGHADLMGLEASVGGKRFFVDAGTYDYEDSDMRALCRGTGGHNTSQVDGLNHADIWSRFRMGRRGKIRSVDSGQSPDGAAWVLATHDAYRSHGVASTARCVIALPDATWIVIDSFECDGKHEVASHLRLHPDVTFERTEASGSASHLLRCEALEIGGEPTIGRLIPLGTDTHVTTAESWYCPDFGCRQPTHVFTFSKPIHGSDWIGWAFRAAESLHEPHIELNENEIFVQSGETRLVISRRST